jgi:DUF438 domain-containing protein
MMITGDDRRQRGFQAAAHAAHRVILEQHRELRRLLAGGLVQTCALSGVQSAPSALPALVGQIRAAFIAHLSYEDAALLPLFDDERLGGPPRTQILREEHARQRREMETLHALSEAGSIDALVNRFDGLARALLIDIAEEERQFALAVAVLDDRLARTCPASGSASTGSQRASDEATRPTR